MKKIKENDFFYLKNPQFLKYFCVFLHFLIDQTQPTIHQSENPNQNKILYKHYKLANHIINYLQNPNQPLTKPDTKTTDQTPSQEQVLIDQTHTS